MWVWDLGPFGDANGSVLVLTQSFVDVQGSVYVMAGNTDLILRLHSVKASYPRNPADPGEGDYDPIESILSGSGVHFEDV